ncbi:MAG: S9 family peptidase [Planctomycetota bacterium]|nr:S9 family peptidase [Planctomycetota bacterium]
MQLRLLPLVGALALAGCAVVPGPGSSGRLTLDDLIELPPKLRLESAFAGWSPDSTSFLCLRRDPASGARRIARIDVASGAEKPFADAQALTKAFAAAPGVDKATAERFAARTRFDWTAARDGVLLNESKDLFFLSLESERAVRLTNDPREEVGETLAPDGKHVAFVADWNLWVAPTDGSSPPRALTTAGNENLLHGRLDWVYQEEVYGRGNFGAFWWSPDSTRLAYLVIDESRVPTYVVTDHRQVHPVNEAWRYPKAGDPNPVATLHVVELGSGKSTPIELGPWSKDEPLIVRVGWTPDATRVLFQIQNRVQTWLDLVEADPATGTTKTLLRDSTAAWIEPNDGPWWIENGRRFLWLSERDGFAHLYLYSRDGKLERRVTRGPWEVDSFVRFDETSGEAWFLGDRDDVKGAQLFRCKLDGSEPVRVTREDGTHVVQMAPDGRHFVDTFSSASEWPQLRLCAADGSVVRELERVDGAPAAAKGVKPAKFVKLRTRDGAELEGALILPPGFSKGRRYPTLLSIYAGPHAPRVLDRPLTTDGLFHTMLAQEGYVVLAVDNRSASGRGLEATKAIWQRLGEGELADLEDAVDWLVAQGIADPGRVGLWGWSYGGYQTAFALTHSKKFRCGIVGAPVTDWRLYDSIYTERYMGLPTENEAGYRSSSVLESAANLSGRALLIHGVIDENVHLQNTLQFAERLQRAGQPFDLMLYPGNRHGIVDPVQNRHKYLTMAAFLRANL